MPETCPDCSEPMVEESDEIGIWWTCPVCSKAFHPDDLDGDEAADES